MKKVLNLILVTFLCLDLGFQSTDFDFDGVSADIRIVVFGLQIIVQVLVCMVFFIMLTSTYLFQVGLLEKVLREFWPPLIMQLFYLLYTTLLGTYCMVSWHSNFIIMDTTHCRFLVHLGKIVILVKCIFINVIMLISQVSLWLVATF